MLTIEQLCEWAQITPRTLRKLWSEGCGPRRVHIGGSIRIRWSDAKAWANSRPVDFLSA
ncbi:MAG: helix-turn-helix transcriptional regulator [Pseudonocardiaceae bacterium]